MVILYLVADFLAATTRAILVNFRKRISEMICRIIEKIF